MESKPVLPPEIIDAFHLMWGNFPEPVSLVHKSREVMAVNKSLEKLGYVKPGMNCAQVGPPGSHKGCLANKAVATKQATYSYSKQGDKEIIGYWLPLESHPDFFVHFGVGVTIDYKSLAADVVALET